MNIEERLELFKPELEAIVDDRLKEFAKLCLATAPEYIFTDCPASTTGKHHPLNEIGWDGTIIHTKKVFNLGYAISRALDIEDKRDLVLCACLIHDLVKKGWEGGQWTKKNHPQLGAELVDIVQRDTQLLSDDEYSTIRSCVFYHYGPWTTKASAKPMSDFSLEELCVYISDYVAAKRFVEVQYRGVDHE